MAEPCQILKEKLLGELITSKTRLRLLIKFFVSQANKGYLNGLATEMGESTNGIRKELNHLHEAGYLQKLRLIIRLNIRLILIILYLRPYEKL
jgi:hypothetical protein